MYSIEIMKLNRPNNTALDIAAFLALSTLIITATLATISQMQKDMLAAESATEFSASYKPQTLMPSIPVVWSNRQK